MTEAKIVELESEGGGVEETIERAKTRDILKWLREMQDAYLDSQNLVAAIRHGRAADEIEHLRDKVDELEDILLEVSEVPDTPDY